MGWLKSEDKHRSIIEELNRDVSFSYPRLPDLSTPKTWACLQCVENVSASRPSSPLLLFIPELDLQLMWKNCVWLVFPLWQKQGMHLWSVTHSVITGQLKHSPGFDLGNMTWSDMGCLYIMTESLCHIYFRKDWFFCQKGNDINHFDWCLPLTPKKVSVLYTHNIILSLVPQYEILNALSDATKCKFSGIFTSLFNHARMRKGMNYEAIMGKQAAVPSPTHWQVIKKHQKGKFFSFSASIWRNNFMHVQHSSG